MEILGPNEVQISESGGSVCDDNGAEREDANSKGNTDEEDS